ncbi:hypothetical protein [Hymenobacter sp.]|uniref:hypothetical protein n=1 Tax=Hymenobacter sp. TaxID=1898978 RepID=UPI002ED91CDD
MKSSLLFRLLTFSLFLLISSPTWAQTPPAAPTLPGYWNLETNLTTRNYTIVRFYNHQDQLVYEEQLDNLCLDLGKGNGRCRRTTRQLNTALQRVLRNPSTTTEATLLAAELGGNRRVQRLYAVR